MGTNVTTVKVTRDRPGFGGSLHLASPMYHPNPTPHPHTHPLLDADDVSVATADDAAAVRCHRLPPAAADAGAVAAAAADAAATGDAAAAADDDDACCYW